MTDKYDEMAETLLDESGLSVRHNKEWLATAIRKAVAEAKREFGEECAEIADEHERTCPDAKALALYREMDGYSPGRDSCARALAVAIRAKVAEIR